MDREKEEIIKVVIQDEDHQQRNPSSYQNEIHVKTPTANIQKGDAVSSSSSPSPASSSHSESSPLSPRVVEEQRMNPFCKVSKLLFLLFFPSRTFLKFLVHAVIPALADNLIPLFFVGNIPNESALALAGQFKFIEVIVEVIQEGIVNSLFYFVGRNYTLNRAKSLQALKICLIILFTLGGLLTICMLLFNSQFVNLIDTPPSIAEVTKDFLYISSFSFPLSLVNSGLSNFLLITTSSYLMLAQLSNVILSFLCNFFLFGTQSFSLHWNIEELGYYKIIITSLSCLNSFIFTLIIERKGPFEFLFGTGILSELHSNLHDLFKVSWGNFGDSAVRNFFYVVVTLKFINNLGETEIAAWNLLNSIVWGLLLIPSFTVANYVKVKIGHDGTKPVIRKVANDCIKCLFAWLLLISMISMILWPQLANFFGKSNESAQVLSTKLFHEMGWIFIIFSLNNTMDALFYGIGKTQYVFYQSLLTNLLVYFIPWILYLCNVLTPTYWLVVGLYIGGMIIDFGLTTYYCIVAWRNIPDYV